MYVIDYIGNKGVINGSIHILIHGIKGVFTT